MTAQLDRVIRVLITGVGHPITLGTLESLRRMESEKFYLVGVDVRERGSFFPWVDRHYHVPPACSGEYIPAIAEICTLEGIDIVVPWSDDEVLAVSRAAPMFKEMGVATLCGPHQSVEQTVDKGKMLIKLKSSGIPTPDFALASTPEEIERAASEMGYPDTPVVVKPRRGSCGRGLWIVQADVDLMQMHPGQRLTLSALLAVLREAESAGKDIPEYLAMPFLEGEDYSVDVLADSGEPLFIIPRKRIRAVDGVSQVCEIVSHPEVRSTVERIVREFGLHLNVNVQLKHSPLRGTPPLVYEINPRISGTIVANDAAGVNLLYYGIVLALGRPLAVRDSFRVRQMRMFRLWTERYTYYDRWFQP